MTETQTTPAYRFNDYGTYLKNKFGERVKKLSINTGYSCPNRDGTKAYHGCTYCNISSILPNYARRSLTITEQLEKGVEFFRSRQKATRYLAYFQSYTNTYKEINVVSKAWEEALRFPGVAGLVIGTRPDCVSVEMANYLKSLARTTYVALEIGIESTDEYTLQRVNRCHTFQDVVRCLDLFAGSAVHTGAHLILGFPWESRATMLRHAERISALPLNAVKLHHLQILKHTQLATEHRDTPFSFMTVFEYADLVTEFVEQSRPDLVFQRFMAEASPELLIAPDYGGIRNNEFTQTINRRLIMRNSFQGCQYTAQQM